MNRLFLPLIALLLSPALLAATECASPLRVGFDDWPPYHYREVAPPSRVHGYAAEVLSAVLTRMGCEVTYLELPWKRVLHGLEYGEIDVAMEANMNDERARYAYFSDPYNPGRTLLWVRQGKVYQEQDLATWLAKGYRLGITKDYFYGDEVMALLARYPGQVSAVSDKQNYVKLARGRIDGFLGDMLATPSGLGKEGMEGQFSYHPMVVYESPSYFMLSRQTVSAHFLAQFNQALAAFKATSDYERIWRRYTRVR
ncbi:substrate-binding periplasmic protein [Aeromonas bivalvium]|uniref:substrate-binding periplasmic protein n=1 Tax=Aeromonas bivalvium TaxID=440079 RepID=UPI003D26283F